jgi:hypothetical protein
MVPLLFVLAFFCTLIAFGVCVSVYLYEGGAVGKRRRVRATLAAESTAEDYGEDESYSYMGSGPTVSTTSRLTRSSLLAILMGLVVIVMLITSFVSTVLH